jgi:hypothetical protein
MPKHKNWFWLAALVAACLFDVLFWKQSFGVSFVIWIAVLLAAGNILAWREGKKAATASLVLTLLVLAFAFVPAWRSEPFTVAVSVMLALGGLLLLSATFLNGHWPFYRMWDYFKNLFSVVGGGLSRAILLGTKNTTPPSLGTPEVKKPSRKFWAVVRGLFIALPIVALLAILLSSADPVFGDWLKTILNLDKLPEYLFRAFYVAMITSFLVGVFLHAILPTGETRKPDTQQAWMKPFLGWTETGIILGAVDLLFLAFVFIQVRYLFGGTANINETGYTFADYARRGFFELVAVAVISMGLYLGLHTVSKREKRSSNAGFTILSVLLMANVLVILASSLQRLMLYEDAYGFSRLRTYTHVFIFFLAALILVTIVLELIRRRGHFALALLVTSLGFSATLAVMNVDGFIAQKNISRAAAGEELDVPHLVSLSADAVPVLVKNYLDTSTPKKVKDALGATLACVTQLELDPGEKTWQGFNLGVSNGYQLLQSNKAAWSHYKLMDDGNRGWYFLQDGEEINCTATDWMD